MLSAHAGGDTALPEHYHLPTYQYIMRLVDVDSNCCCSHDLQLPHLLQQQSRFRTCHHHTQPSPRFQQCCSLHDFADVAQSSFAPVGSPCIAKTVMLKQRVVHSRCRCSHASCPTGSLSIHPGQSQHDCFVRHRPLLEQLSGGFALPDFAIRLCINLLGACL